MIESDTSTAQLADISEAQHSAECVDAAAPSSKTRKKTNGWSALFAPTLIPTPVRTSKTDPTTRNEVNDAGVHAYREIESVLRELRMKPLCEPSSDIVAGATRTASANVDAMSRRNSIRDVGVQLSLFDCETITGTVPIVDEVDAMPFPVKKNFDIAEICPIKPLHLVRLMLLPPRQLILLSPFPLQRLLAPPPRLLLLPAPRPILMLPPRPPSIDARTCAAQTSASIDSKIGETAPAPDQTTLHLPATEARSVGEVDKPAGANEEYKEEPISRTQSATTKLARAVRQPRGDSHPRRVRPQKWTAVEQILGDSDRDALAILQRKYAERLANRESAGEHYPQPTGHIQIGPSELRDGGLGCKKTAQRCLDRLAVLGFIEAIDRKFVAEGEATIHRLIPLDEVAATKLRSGLTHFVNGGNGSRKAVAPLDDCFRDTLDDSAEGD